MIAHAAMATIKVGHPATFLTEIDMEDISAGMRSCSLPATCWRRGL